MEPSQRIYGHERPIRALREALREGRLHHTLLFSGPEGVGKRLVARELAATLLCQSNDDLQFGGCGSCHHCSLVKAGNMPDLIEISCSDKTAASTEAVREVLRTLRLRPFAGKFRFLIFDDAEQLQGQAANILLKSLEEPKPGTHFILVTGKPHLMLRTILSRAQRWGFHRLAAEELEAVLKDEVGDPDPHLLRLANGSIESYTMLSGRGESVRALEGTLTRIAEGNTAEALRLGEELAKSKEELELSLECMLSIARAQLQETNNLRWANFLHELGEMPHYLLRRNFAPQYLLQKLLLNLAEGF